jgi:hypothetical protein
MAQEASHAEEPTLEQRLRWHAAHAMARGCRKMPPSILRSCASAAPQEENELKRRRR